MSKYHINSKGIPAICKAEKGNCPFGGENGTENHYDTIEQAQEAANKINEEQFGIMSKIHHENKEYKISENTPKETRINKNLFLKNNHSLRKSGNIWVHLDENDNIVGIMKDPIVLAKKNGELLDIVDNGNEDIQNSIIKLKAMNLMSKFNLISKNSLDIYVPEKDIEDYKAQAKKQEKERNLNSYNALKIKINAKGGNKTEDLFSNYPSKISAFFEEKNNYIEHPEIIDYNPEIDDWEKVVPHIDNFSINAWKTYNMDLHQINDKWAVIDNKGNLIARMDNPAVVVNFDTENIESIGEFAKLSKECEDAKHDIRFTENNNKMLNRIGLAKMDDNNNELSHIRNLFNYSWAFKNL